MYRATVREQADCCLLAGKLHRSFCSLRLPTATRNIRTESSAAASSAGASLDARDPSLDDVEQVELNPAQKLCSSARYHLHQMTTVTIPEWLALKVSQFRQWVAKGQAQADAMGILKNVKRTALVIPFASAVTGAKGPSELFIMLNQAVYHFVNLYLLFLFIRYRSMIVS
jgi:hypothetical protein